MAAGSSARAAFDLDTARSVEKSRSGIAAGVLNATRQTGSVLGVALFGSLVGVDNAFIMGAHASLVISAAVLLAGAVAICMAEQRRDDKEEAQALKFPRGVARQAVS